MGKERGATQDQITSSEGVSRRKFLQGSALALTGVAGAGLLSGCINNSNQTTDEATAKASYLPTQWDAETEILVVGCGGAGIAAGITAATEGLGKCIVLEAAPVGQEGGNTRVSAQVIFCPDTPAGAIIRSDHQGSLWGQSRSTWCHAVYQGVKGRYLVMWWF